MNFLSEPLKGGTLFTDPTFTELNPGRVSALERTLIRLAIPLTVLGIVVYLAGYAPLVLTWPPVSSDEGRELNAFWVASGIDPNATLLDPFYGRDPLYTGGLQGLSVGMVLQVFGLNLSAARLVSSVWGALLLVAMLLAGRRLFGIGAAVVATALLAASHPFLFSAHFIRPDIVVAALLMGALYFALSPTGSVAAHVIAGLLLGFALDVHPYTVALIPVVALAYLFSSNAASRRAGIWCAVGLGIGAAIYLLGRVVPNPQTFASSLGFWVGMEHRPPVLDGFGLETLRNEWRRFVEFWAERPLGLAIPLDGPLGDQPRVTVEMLAVLGGFGWALWRAGRGSRPHLIVATGVAAVFVGFSLIVSSKVPYYLVLYYAPLCLLLGAAISDFVRRAPGRVWLGGAVTAVFALFAFGLLSDARDLYYRYRTTEHDFPLLQHTLDRAVPADAVVMGKPIYWLALSNRRFVDIAVADRLRRERSLSLADAVRESGATVILIDTDTRQAMPSRDRVWMNDHFQTREVIEQDYYGSIDVRFLGERD